MFFFCISVLLVIICRFIPAPQVYLYTFTGLHDKAGNHLTQFMGVLLK